MEERRQHGRVPVDRPVHIHLSDGGAVVARMIEVSSAGIGILYPAPAEIGAVLELHFSLPHGDRFTEFHLRGTVAHSYLRQDGYHTGIRFNDLTAVQRTEINLFLLQKEQQMSNSV